MVKKVVIAAAGKGTRMLHLSKDKPKHLIKVNGRPFLSYLLDNLFFAGYKDIILVGGYMGEQMLDFKKNYLPPKQGKFKIKFINQFDRFDPEEKCGTACPLMCVRDEIKEQFLYICGDNLFSVEDLKSMNINDEFCYIAGIKQDHPEKYGVLVSAGEYLEKIVEKPQKFVGDIINAGLYKFTPEIFDKILKIKKSPRGEYEITDAVSLLAEEKRVKIKRISSWIDFGNPEDIEKLSKFLEDGNNKNQ
jgi:NDP-sugar pyrophosphorylase family protein